MGLANQLYKIHKKMYWARSITEIPRRAKVKNVGKKNFKNSKNLKNLKKKI